MKPDTKACRWRWPKVTNLVGPCCLCLLLLSLPGSGEVGSRPAQPRVAIGEVPIEVGRLLRQSTKTNAYLGHLVVTPPAQSREDPREIEPRLAHQTSPPLDAGQDRDADDDDDDADDDGDRRSVKCRKSGLERALKKFTTTLASDSQCVVGGERASIVVSSKNVLVDERSVSDYRLTIDDVGGTGRLTEVGDGVVLNQQVLGDKFHLRLLHFGEMGYFLLPTRDFKDARLIEPIDPSGGLESEVHASVFGQHLFLDDASGPFRSWENRTRITGFRGALFDRINSLTDGITRLDAALQQDAPSVKILTFIKELQRGDVPTLDKENVLVTGTGIIGAFSWTFPAPAELGVKVTDEISSTLQLFNQWGNQNPKLSDMRREIAAFTLLKIVNCVLSRLDGSFGDQDAFECVDEIQDISEALAEEPNCDEVCAAPKAFSIEQCKTGVPNTYDAIDVMDEICDIYRSVGPQVLIEPNDPDAAGEVEKVKRNIERFAKEIWRKVREFCNCP